MRLRTVILLSLFLFGLVPVVAVVGLNLPMVLSSLETLVHRSQLQNLRVEFGDLDQFLASRKEMVRVLTKLPEPVGLFHEETQAQSLFSGQDSSAFTGLINQILAAGQDIYEVVYLDEKGDERFRLMRGRLDKPLRSMELSRSKNNHLYFQIGMHMQTEGVYVSPIKFTEQPALDGSYHPMIMRMVSPVLDQKGEPEGVVLISIDVGGLPNAYRNTIWVMNDGGYLHNPSRAEHADNAFLDFPGLEEIFAQGSLVLWRGSDGTRVIWVPLFLTEKRGPLWVGRYVDPTGLETFRTTLRVRVLVIFAILLGSVLLLARWGASRVSRFGEELKRGIGRVLDNEPNVVFSWQGPRELQMLGRDLTRLADAHARTTQDLFTRAQQLEESNRYKSEFLANVSHELRTPLNAILLLSKILGGNAQGNLTADQVKQANVIRSAGTDLLALINDILDISKIEAKKTTIHLQTIDLRGFWRPVVDLFEPMALEKGVQTVCRVASDLPDSIVSDQDKLRQILNNFLANAVKFTSKGQITLSLRPNQGQDRDERPIRISVIDTGVGIPKDKQGLIFEAFRQADGSTSRRYGGTGLGLTISNEIAKLLGGRIEVESDEGQGASFSLLLPLAFDTAQVDPKLVSVAEEGGGGEAETRSKDDEAPQHHLVQAERVEAGGRDDTPEFSGRRILVVERDLHTLLSLSPVLDGWGFEVTAAGSLEEALDTLEQDARFDVALVDIMMDGVEGIQRLREPERCSGLPLLVVGNAPHVQDLLAVATEVLRKPLDPPALQKALRKVLQEGEATAAKVRRQGTNET